VRRLVALLLALAVALAGATAGLAGKGDPQRAITKADQAKAKAMLLRRTDLAAGFRATPASPDPDWYCAALDESDLTLTGDAETPQWTKQQPGVFFVAGSTAQLYRTNAQAQASWRRGTSTAGEKCVRVLLDKELAKSGLHIRSLTRMSFPRLSAQTAAYRLVIESTTQTAAPALYGDLVVQQRGRAQTSVMVFSLGAPLVRAELVTFARTVAQRMAKAMGG
jgi:hypothetical protein